MKKALTPILAVIAVVAIIFCFVFNGQKGDIQTQLDAAKKATEDVQAKLTEATAQVESLKAEAESKSAEAAAAAETLQKSLDEANAQIETLKAEAAEKATAADAVKAELEEKVASLTKQVEEAAAAAKEKAAEVVEEAKETVEEVKDAVTDAVEGAAEAVEGAKEEATEAVEEAVEGAADAAEEVAAEVADAVAGEAAVMSHADYIAAENDSEVVIESYVQDHQAWWSDKVTVYLQSEDGAYFAYEMACSEEDAAKLVPGTKIRVKGYKGEWAGEVEIMDGTFEFVDAEPWIAEAADVTALLASEELANHMNEFVAVKGATIVAQADGAAFNYKNTEEKNDDLYFSVEVDGATYNFCVEKYLRDESTDVYKAVEALNVGDVVDLEGFLYWYNGANLQATSVTVK